MLIRSFGLPEENEHLQLYEVIKNLYIRGPYGYIYPVSYVYKMENAIKDIAKFSSGN